MAGNIIGALVIGGNSTRLDSIYYRQSQPKKTLTNANSVQQLIRTDRMKDESRSPEETESIERGINLVDMLITKEKDALLTLGELSHGPENEKVQLGRQPSDSQSAPLHEMFPKEKSKNRRRSEGYLKVKKKATRCQKSTDSVGHLKAKRKIPNRPKSTPSEPSRQAPKRQINVTGEIYRPQPNPDYDAKDPLSPWM